jgi:tetratricopeptide (TPR) repeat protein
MLKGEPSAEYLSTLSLKTSRTTTSFDWPLALLLIVLLLAPRPAVAQTGKESSLVGSVSQFGPNDPYTRGGFEHLYNHEYDKAIHDFELVAQARPNDPFAVNHLLTAVLFRELNRMGALDTALYTTDAFLGTKVLPVDPRARDQIMALTARTRLLSNALLDANPNNVDALYARGVTDSLRATYSGLVDKAWLGALRSALNARRDHERVLQLAPQYTDAKLVVGIHEYVVGSLPWWLKTGISVFGVRGSKSRGIEDLYVAANGGGETAVNARIALSLFLRREHKYAEALPLVKMLITSYPRNFLFVLEEANLLNALGQRQEATAAFRKLLVDNEAGVYPNARPELIWYGLGETLQEQHEYGEAGAAYQHVLEYPQASPDLRRKASVRASEMRAHSRRKQQVPTSALKGETAAAGSSPRDVVPAL